jgi:putative addiction module killer protein
MSDVAKTKVQRTDAFDAWLAGLQDDVAKGAINDRIDRVKGGNLGDVKKVKGAPGLYEIRVDVGPGYRVYFIVVGNTIILLLLGGNKGTQTADIKKAKAMFADMQKRQAAAKKKREEDEKKAAKAAEKARQSNKSKRK